jgi:hypothetical protein
MMPPRFSDAGRIFPQQSFNIHDVAGLIRHAIAEGIIESHERLTIT